MPQHAQDFRPASGKNGKAARAPGSQPDTSEDEGEAAPAAKECWLRPTLRPNRTLVIRNKYDSGSDTDTGAAKATPAGGMKTMVIPRKQAMLQALVDAETKGGLPAKEESDAEESRWGVRRRGPGEP